MWLSLAGSPQCRVPSRTAASLRTSPDGDRLRTVCLVPEHRCCVTHGAPDRKQGPEAKSLVVADCEHVLSGVRRVEDAHIVSASGVDCGGLEVRTNFRADPVPLFAKGLVPLPPFKICTRSAVDDFEVCIEHLEIEAPLPPATIQLGRSDPDVEIEGPVLVDVLRLAVTTPVDPLAVDLADRPTATFECLGPVCRADWSEANA